jgi:hypothetical protein
MTQSLNNNPKKILSNLAGDPVNEDDSRSDKNTFKLAKLIIIGYFVTLLVMIILAFANNVSNYEGVQLITATVGTIASAVVGYYFGNKPVAQAMEASDKNKNFAIRTIMQSIEESEKTEKILEEIESKMKALKENLLKNPNDNTVNLMKLDDIIDVTNNIKKEASATLKTKKYFDF